MGLKRRAAPRFEPEVHETIWIGDDAVDRDSSDVVGWCETADISHLKLTKEDASIIRYRGLTDREVSMLPRSGEDGVLPPLYYFEAARYGIVGVKGMHLTRRREGGVMGLTDAALDSLTEWQASIPIIVALAKAYSNDSEYTRPKDPRDVETALTEWVGVHIMGLTFRARRRGK